MNLSSPVSKVSPRAYASYKIDLLSFFTFRRFAILTHYLVALNKEKDKECEVRIVFVAFVHSVKLASRISFARKLQNTGEEVTRYL